MSAYDVIIIGGGPAGIAAGIWCADLGLSAVLFDKGEEPGGQLFDIYNAITNYPGGSYSNGSELQRRFAEHLSRTNVSVRRGCAISSIDAGSKTVLLEGESFSARSLIVATGVRRRKLSVPGEDELRGRGILHSGAMSRHEVKGRRVVIVGGGDAAVENALILGREAAHVTLVHRRDEFTARAEFLDEMRKLENIKPLLDAEVVSFDGGDRLGAVSVRTRDGLNRTIDCDNALIRIGVEPNSDLVRGRVATDDRGYIEVDRYGLTDIDGVFAIGDVSSPLNPTISTAVGVAAAAAKFIASKNIRNSELSSKK